MINKDNKNNINLNKANVSLLKDDVKKLKIEYEKEIEKYKIASRSIIETEEKFNNVSKKINKINYKQMIMTNKINNDYIENLNECKLEQNIKITILSLFGFPFPNQEPFYFTSPEDLIAQLSISKDFLFNLVLTNKSEFEKIKSSFDHLNKNLIILRPIYDYMKLNFDIVNLLQKRENIFEENKKYIKSKDSSLINVKMLEKKIKEKYAAMKSILKSNKSQKTYKEQNKKTKDIQMEEMMNNSHLLSIRDFDEISGKSFILSLSNENSILDLFEEDEINRFEMVTKKIEHKNYNNNYARTYNETEQFLNERNLNSINRYSKSPDTNSNLMTEEQKNYNNKANNQKTDGIVEKYRSPQNKLNRGKDTLKIEKSVTDSGCCASCT
jgi:hypothetical protein